MAGPHVRSALTTACNIFAESCAFSKMLRRRVRREEKMKKRVVKITVSIVVVGLLLCGAALGAIMWHIRQTVQGNCQSAQHAHPYPGDDVAALIDFMNSESHSLWDRTHRGVWTLGQIRDPRALSALESAYTGELCQHDTRLCQGELEKAIKLCGGVPNPPRQRRN